MTTEITLLLTRTGAAGERTEFTLTLEGAGGQVRSSRYTGHYGTARSAGRPEADCLYKVAAGARGRRAIENELAVFSTLGWAGMNDHRFAELLGYDLDPDEGGAVLVQSRRGRALARRERTTTPTTDQLWQPTYDLLSALSVLAHHNYVHGAISSTTVFWDGEGLQIADLATATTQPPDGDGFAQDVRNAAGLLYWLASGEPSAFGYLSGGASPEQELDWLKAHRPDLAIVLGPVYEGESPTADELLERLRLWPRPVRRPAETDKDGGPPPDGERERERDEDAERTHKYGNGRDEGHTRPVPRPRPDDPAERRFKKYLGETLTSMHVRDDPPANPDPLPGADHVGADRVGPGRGLGPRQPRPEPGTLPPVLENALFRVGADGARRPHPLALAAGGAVILLIVLLVVVV